MTAEIKLAPESLDLFVLAIAVAFLAVAAVSIPRFLFRMAHEPREHRRLWQTMVGVAVGITLWSTGMMVALGRIWVDAQGQPVEIGFDVAPLALALAASIGLSVAVFHAGLEGERSAFQAALMGLGGGGSALAVHLLAVHSMHAAGRFQLDPTASVFSGVFALAFFGAGSLLLFGPDRMTRRALGLAVVLIGAAGLTVSAAMAPNLVPDPTVEIPSGLVDRGSLGFMVGAISALTAAIIFLFSRIDLASARATEETYRHLALHDPLTGLPNRAYLTQELERMLSEARAERESGGIGHGGAAMAAVGVDLDRFKPINDVQGHAAGDAVLQGIAARVADVLEPGEIFARTGGDEFVALKSPCTRAEAERFAHRLHDAIAQPIDWAGSSLDVGASLGIALHPRDGEEADALLGRVDLALYRAKRESGGRIVFYDRRMDEDSRDRSALAMELRQALARGEFELHYQPQTALDDGHVVAYEALIRWHHPERGLVLPDAFIPVAERTGLIRDIGAWVLHAACREAAAWSEPLGVAVNVAPVQLSQSDFVELVRDALTVSGLEASRLELEVTEASLIADHAQLRSVMIALKAVGVRVAMDDYGAGYASLAALRSFPFDKIKIDRGFVESLGRDPQSLAIVRSTLMLARALSIPVLAEGIVSEDGLRVLREEGCTEGQGFLFGRPVEAAAVRRRMGMNQEPAPPLPAPGAMSSEVSHGAEAAGLPTSAASAAEPAPAPARPAQTEADETLPPETTAVSPLDDMRRPPPRKVG